MLREAELMVMMMIGRCSWVGMCACTNCCWATEAGPKDAVAYPAKMTERHCNCCCSM